MQIVSYRKKGRWYRYRGKLSDEVEAVQTTEQMTLEELKKNYPEVYKSMKIELRAKKD